MSNTFTTYLVGIALLLAVASHLAAAGPPQAGKPSFAGVWTFTNSTPQQSAGGGGGSAAMRPGPLTIRQTDTSIAIDHTFAGQTTTMTFSIGAEKNDTNRTGAQVWTTRTRWDGKALVTSGRIEQNTSAGFDEWTYVESRTLDARGHMII